MSNVIEASNRFARHLTEARPAADGLEAVGCMDDRNAKPADQVLGKQLYHQTPGGAHGIGFDLAVAMEVEKPNSFVSQRKPVHVLGNIAVKTLRGKGFNPVLHGHCAAFEGTAAISHTLTKVEKTEFNHGLMFKRAQIASPDITHETYWGTVHATRRILESGLIVPTSQAAMEFANHSRNMPMVPTAELVDEEHTAQAFLINTSPGTMFDVAAARAAGDPAYAISMGALRTMQEELQDLIPVSSESFLNATAVRLGAISTHHLLGEDQQPLPMLRIAV